MTHTTSDFQKVLTQNLMIKLEKIFQVVTNEKFNETLSMDRGQGLRRIMNSPISSRSMGCFSLLHSTLTESSIITSATAGPKSRDSSDWSQKET